MACAAHSIKIRNKDGTDGWTDARLLHYAYCQMQPEQQVGEGTQYASIKRLVFR